MRARTWFLSGLGVLLLVGAVVLSLRFGWFETRTSPVVLPDTTAVPTAENENGEGDPLVLADVTPETVQAVVSTLNRPDGYERQLTVTSFWSDGSRTWQVMVWQKGAAVRIRIDSEDGTQPSKNILLRSGILNIWYEDPGEDYQTRIDPETPSDILQYLPRYEDLLEVDPGQIEEAGYVESEGVWRIMASVREEPTQYRMVYYISIETGLLEAAERWDGDRLIYRMIAQQAELAAPDDRVFFLPEDAAEGG